MERKAAARYIRCEKPPCTGEYTGMGRFLRGILCFRKKMLFYDMHGVLDTAGA